MRIETGIGTLFCKNQALIILQKKSRSTEMDLLIRLAII